ncbi:rhodanese-like domain-containing protein [Fictibacillus nanhaiensis]|uniref:rhodanese-like domain-containing protein n=1 Tax=Fictibacillus nanhaiensis TaxID=742169 RepID=UPI002E1C79E1|nr:rhodanese-like domain-containing protein [Fictibacillus nanhaiensis]
MKQITAKELEKKLNEGHSLHTIDVRETSEVKEGKIPKTTINIPLGLLEFRMHELDKAEEYVLVCRSGGRSSQAYKFLESHGFNVINMVGGMEAWEGKTE